MSDLSFLRKSGDFLPQQQEDTNMNFKSIKIPRILHQMWLDEKNPDCLQPPSKYLVYGYPQTFKKYNSTWTHMFWNLNKVKELFKTNKNLQKFEGYFLKLKPIIKQCDFARHAIIYVYGGIYVDLDFECKKSLDSLIENRIYLYVKEASYFLPYSYRYVYNGFFGSIPNTELSLFCLKEITKYQRSIFTFPSLDIMLHTGPFGLRNHLIKFQKENKILQKHENLFIPTAYVFECPRLMCVLLERIKFIELFYKQKKLLYVYTRWIEGTNYASKN